MGNSWHNRVPQILIRTQQNIRFITIKIYEFSIISDLKTCNLLVLSECVLCYVKRIF